MQYEDIKVKKPKKSGTKLHSAGAKRMALADVEQLNLGSWTIVGFLIKRHKYGLVLNLFVLENIALACHALGIF